MCDEKLRILILRSLKDSGYKKINDVKIVTDIDKKEGYIKVTRYVCNSNEVKYFVNIYRTNDIRYAGMLSDASGYVFIEDRTYAYELKSECVYLSEI